MFPILIVAFRIGKVVFNIFSIIFPFVGQWLGWSKLDPIGGCVLSLYIIIEWVSTLLENTAKLTGKRATPSEHQRVAYLLSRFSPLIVGVQHLSLYHAGDQLVVECDIMYVFCWSSEGVIPLTAFHLDGLGSLPHQTTLTAAHNLGESVQYAIESLEGVDRAFVHVDVSVNPLSGHLTR